MYGHNKKVEQGRGTPLRTLEVIPAKPAPPKRLKVAAYARVSSDVGRLPASFAAQVSYYSRLIQGNPTWEYAGVYSDEGITGTSTRKRDGFNNLMDAARSGDVDLILTKSISRFARNTVDLLAAVRELTSLGVPVRFERENIDTSTADGELLLTLLASFAQAESEQISQNTKWGITRGFQAGKPTPCQIYGYRYVGGTLEIIEEEAAVVRRLFHDYLAGITPEATAEALNREGVKPRRGKKFLGKNLRRLLENERYTGRVLAQKCYRTRIADNASTTVNRGELPRYLIEDAHPAIIDDDTFEAVQKELARRRQVGLARSPGGYSALTSKVVCTECSRHFHRRTRTTRAGVKRVFWWCWTATQGTGNPCGSPQVGEQALKDACVKALGLDEWDPEAVLTRIENITVAPGGRVRANLHNGETKEFTYAKGVMSDV